MTNALVFKSALELSELLEKRSVSSKEIMQAFIDRVDQTDAQVGAFLSYDAQKALDAAEASDQRRAKGEALSPLDGIPVGIKDILAVKGERLTCASRMLEHFISPYDATCTKKLKAAGAILWGRLNMDEFAMGTSTEHSAFQKTANPWNLGYVPGGSSGGSSAAVSAAQAPLSIGSDTGGSVRQPASFCGLIGLKPTYGRVSRYGLVAFASSLDQLGPMGHEAEDVALLLQHMAGHDALDSTSLNQPVPNYLEQTKASPKMKRIGVPKEYFAEGLDAEVRASVEKAIAFFSNEGFEVKEISLPRTDLSIATYYIIATAEASSNLSRYDGVRYTHRSAQAQDTLTLFERSRGEGFGPEVKRRILMGTYALSSGYYDAHYVRAQKVRNLIYQDFMRAFESVDVILGPTTPAPAFKFGENLHDPLAMYLCDMYTTSVNLAGLPALSVPCGLTQSGLPIGLQMTGKPFTEGDLLSLTRFYQERNTWEKHPDLSVKIHEKTGLLG